ncbi:uncharacterized protein LOC114249936 [Bombyx mandarina]|uniref:Uncharacterized protein LOC114249936 n=1 Tax=Bombyx mandarina TaxID=7092 RepID=A0A6J2KAY9_BOMMA|nr:uncharacterized protein LOC114249936 [Bombyx mandarina]
MKATFVFALAIIASASAGPQRSSELALQQRNLLEDLVKGFIQLIIESVQASGLDPLYVESAEGTYSFFDLEDVFTATGSLSEFNFEGGSNIIVNDVNFHLLSRAISINLSVPKLQLSVGSFVGTISVFGRDELEVDGSGRVVIENVNVVARLRVGLLPNINIRDVTGTITVGDVESDLNIILFGEEVSDRVNDFLINKLSEALKTYNTQIFEFFERAIIFLIDSLV